MEGTADVLNDVAGVLIETGAVAPAPTALTPAPAVASQPVIPVDNSPCGATESFQITSAEFPAIEGCYQKTSESYANPGTTYAAWTVGGNLEADQVVVSGTADDGTG